MPPWALKLDSEAWNIRIRGGRGAVSILNLLMTQQKWEQGISLVSKDFFFRLTPITVALRI